MLTDFISKQNATSIKSKLVISSWDHSVTSLHMLCSFGQSVCLIESRQVVNTWRPRQNGRHFADDILKSILLNENIWIAINISQNFFPRGQINNNPALAKMYCIGANQARNHYLNQWFTELSSDCFVPSFCSETRSLNGNIFCVTSPFCREFTSHWWIPLTKASDMKFWCFL